MAFKHIALILTALALCACEGKNNGSSFSSNCGEQSSQLITLSGNITYDFVPNAANGSLDYSATDVRPVRGATVSLVWGNNNIYATTTSDENGDFSFSAPTNQIIRVRVTAALQQTGTPGWDISVTDNTSGNAPYVMQGSLTCTGTADQERGLHAASGWTGSSYGSNRTAAPFAILDSVYQALALLRDSDPLIILPPVELRWSTENRAISGNASNGDIGTSNYFNGSIHILGDENNDTDEYDRTVVQHEFAHYLEDAISRSDSRGGQHNLLGALDMRLAFSEGLGNAFAAITSGTGIYADSNNPQQAGGFQFSLETEEFTNRGWYSENTSGLIIYDIFDSNDDGADAISLGFTPIYDTLTASTYREGNARMSIYSFAHTLRSLLPANDAAGVSDLLTEQNVFGTDVFGSDETNDGGTSISLPIYHDLPLGGTINLCSSTFGGVYNGIGVTRFATFEIENSGSYTVEATLTSSNGGRETDPDIIIHQNDDVITQFISTDIDNEGGSIALTAGSYVLEFYDNYNANSGASGLACFDLSLMTGS